MDPVSAPQMTRHGSRIYCHHMDEAQQKWIIDSLGRLICLILPSQIGPIAVEATVRSMRDDKAILDIKKIRVPTPTESRSFLENGR